MDVTFSNTTSNLLCIWSGCQVGDGRQCLWEPAFLPVAIQYLAVRQARSLCTLFALLPGILLCQEAMPSGLTSAKAQNGSSLVCFSA